MALERRQSIHHFHPQEIRLSWAVIGPHGAVEFKFHLYLRDYCEMPNGMMYRVDCAGIEYHHATPTTYLTGPPSHEDCSLIGGPCWHDGSSCAGQELLDAMRGGRDPELIFGELEWLYRQMAADEA